MKPIYLCGPTAIGKSAVALDLADHLNGEIISVDSMQVYRGMDIGTAKPTPSARQTIPHHLIDIADLTESFDAARFVKLASAAEAEITRRGKTPIFCGGTAFYFNALLQGLGESPPSDPALHAALEKIPLPALLDELRAKDPATWEKIDRQNPRRVIRALEVTRLTGQPFSTQRAEWKPLATTNIFGLELSREDLNARIQTRVEQMFAAGLVEETRRLLAHGLRENRTASQALGYKQVLEHLDKEQSLPATVEFVKLRTRQFAKRQMTWFKRQLPCRWIAISKTATAAEISAELRRSLT